MRFLTTALVAATALLAITACSSSSSNSTDASATAAADATTAAATAAADNSMASSGAGSTAMTKANAIPTYPGATVMAAGSSSNMGGSSAGKVMTTADAFAKVYAWYQKNLPAGSEKAHMTTPVESAVFTMGEAGKDQTSVSITTQGGKTMITVAHVKM